MEPSLQATPVCLRNSSLGRYIRNISDFAFLFLHAVLADVTRNKTTKNTTGCHTRRVSPRTIPSALAISKSIIRGNALLDIPCFLVSIQSRPQQQSGRKRRKKRTQTRHTTPPQQQVTKQTSSRITKSQQQTTAPSSLTQDAAYRY